MPGGSVTFGGQTHPADGNAAIIVTTREKARAIHAFRLTTIQHLLKKLCE